MALDPSVKHAVGRLAAALRGYAAGQGFDPEQIRILVEVVPEWGRIHVVFMAPHFPGSNVEEHWLSVIDHLESVLGDDPDLLDSLNLTVNTFEHVAQGGIYSLSPDYVEVDELLAGHFIG